ncbi:hypothetical protein HJC23_010800 [Cyclotella cryptica]|uniref:Uncharacterized protein n=1 Tax=Cyclotella cryptica TaxID=29204 RepID=A0ABD3QNN0_9STRA|eukprot:CCRYP_003533-RA/>CCRYP_003533-RA protein AED:0.22 eAED:0.16 QI:0/-1/0/1/-1/1/1/0/233
MAAMKSFPPTTRRRHLPALLTFLSLANLATSWTPPSTNPPSLPHNHVTSRRTLLQTTAPTTLLLLLLPPPPPSNALPTSSLTPTQQKDITNLQRGYTRLQYLLTHWEAETTLCQTGQETTFDNRCQRTPTKVMEYLGYKSTSDPLFRADVVLSERLRPLVPDERMEEYLEAVEEYGRNAEEANGMAFVSSWGEANPGGGKDRVELFIERSRRNVVRSRDCLGVVLEILGVPVP